VTIDNNRLLGLMDQLSSGLEAIHKKGIIHRDLNPENLVVSFDFSQIKVINFGLAYYNNYTMFSQRN
jgi:serine/threonine protein kinase